MLTLVHGVICCDSEIDNTVVQTCGHVVKVLWLLTQIPPACCHLQGGVPFHPRGDQPLELKGLGGKISYLYSQLLYIYPLKLFNKCSLWVIPNLANQNQP